MLALNSVAGARLPARRLAGDHLDQSLATVHPARPSRRGQSRRIAIPSLLDSLWITTQEAAGGLAASVVAGVAIAMVFAQWRWLRQTLYPYTILLQTVPIVAIAPLVILWVGPGLFAVTVVTFIICLAPIIANTTQGLISVDENLVNLFVMYKASPAQMLFKLRLPNALPNFFTGIRISAGISVIGGITGELLLDPRALVKADWAMP